MEHDDTAFDNTQSHPFLLLLLCGFILALTLSGCGGGGNMDLVQQPDAGPEDNTGEDTGPEDNTEEDTDTGPNTTDVTNSPGSADADALRAAIARGSTGAPIGITITRNHGAPPTIGIRSNVSGDWSDAGPAPVASGTRHYDGYRLTRHAGGGGVKETAWVWTDIQPPAAKDFDQVYELDTDTNDDDMDDALEVVESEHLDLVTHIGRDPGDDRADDMTSVNPKDRGILGQNRTFDEGHWISARFDGAYGIYICIEASCNIDMTGDRLNPLQGMSGWAFRPGPGEEEGTRKPQVLVPDSDYRYFGLWLRGPDDDNEDRFDIRTFTGGSERFSGNITALTGRATYIGPAAGQYVKDTAGGSARSGLFTAKVTLHADFGASPKINGSMGGFRDGGRDLGWSLRFEENNITTQGTFNGRTSGSTHAGGVGGIGDPGNTGTWSGAFYGNGDDGYPNGAVGAFTGRFNDGLVIGGFGANRAITNP